MSSPIQGKNCFLWDDLGGGYKLIACAKSTAIGFDVEMIGIATADSTTDNDYDPGFSDGKVDFEHLSAIDDATKAQFYDFIDSRRIKRNIKMVFTADNGDVLQYEFKALVRNTGTRNTVGGISVGSTSLQICGPVSRSVIASGGGASFYAPGGTVAIYSDYWETTPGDNYITGPSAIHSYDLLGKNILLTIREGDDYTFIGYSGTPVGMESRFNNALERLVFDTALPFNTGERVTVVFTD